jgi:hypothetical protein
VARVFLEYMGDSVELHIGETLIGRDVACSMRFNDPSVSRKHLRFIHRQGEVFVEDLGSSNGTLLNGNLVGDALRIVDGDKISVGTRLLTVRVIKDSLTEPATFVLSKLPPPTARGSSQIAATEPPPLGPQPTPRRHDRSPIELRVVYTSTELEVEAVSRDLSESGVFICSTVLDPLGTRCTLTLLVEGGPSMVVQGVVRRVVDRAERRDGPIGFGVEFVGLDVQQVAWVRMVVARTTDPTRPFELT